MASTALLMLSLRQTEIQLERQLDAARQKAVEWGYEGEDIYRAQLPDGSFLLAPLLVAKAQVQLGMATLKAMPR